MPSNRQSLLAEAIDALRLRIAKEINRTIISMNKRARHVYKHKTTNNISQASEQFVDNRCDEFKQLGSEKRVQATDNILVELRQVFPSVLAAFEATSNTTRDFLDQRTMKQLTSDLNKAIILCSLKGVLNKYVETNDYNAALDDMQKLDISKQTIPSVSSCFPQLFSNPVNLICRDILTYFQQESQLSVSSNNRFNAS